MKTWLTGFFIVCISTAPQAVRAEEDYISGAFAASPALCQLGLKTVFTKDKVKVTLGSAEVPGFPLEQQIKEKNGKRYAFFKYAQEVDGVKKTIVEMYEIRSPELLQGLRRTVDDVADETFDENGVLHRCK